LATADASGAEAVAPRKQPTASTESSRRLGVNEPTCSIGAAASMGNTLAIFAKYWIMPAFNGIQLLAAVL
jgi:hypothetical protein